MPKFKLLARVDIVNYIETPWFIFDIMTWALSVAHSHPNALFRIVLLITFTESTATGTLTHNHILNRLLKELLWCLILFVFVFKIIFVCLLNTFLLNSILLLKSLISSWHLSATRNVNHSLLLLVWLPCATSAFISGCIAIEMTVISTTLISFSWLQVCFNNFSLTMLIVPDCCEVRPSISSQFFIATNWYCIRVSNFLSLMANQVSELLWFLMNLSNPLFVIIYVLLMLWLLLL